MEPRDFRNKIRHGEFNGNTSGYCGGYQQAKYGEFYPDHLLHFFTFYFLLSSVIIIDKEFAQDFELFCQSNSQSCPILSILEPGIVEAEQLAKGSDIRTDVPKYRIWNSSNNFIEVFD